MTPARYETDEAAGVTPPAEHPPTDEVEVARGRLEQTPFAMIGWVAFVIAAVVVLALILVVAAYLIA